MKLTLDISEETLALHIVAVTEADWPNIKLWDVSVPTSKLIDGETITIPEPPKEEEHGE
jgi:hypothetical protein